MRRQQGFTILEMAIAIGIFAIIAVIAYGALIQFLNTRDNLSERHSDLRELQFLFSLIEQDFRFMTDRSVRDEYGDPEIAVIASSGEDLAEGELIRLTTALPDPSSPDWYQLQRVSWRLINGDVYRVHWPVLDRDVDTPENQRLVYKNLAELELVFHTWSDEEGMKSQDEWTAEQKLPYGVELLATLDSGAQYRRLLEVANGS
jgi:general secretion pathway protein J